MEVTANGKTFSFPEGTSTDDIGMAIDEYFSGSAQQDQPQQQSQQPQQQSPSMMDNVEQAARGLANIPFDILQGGANLINAGSRAVGAGDVLDPVYRPVDRPTDEYAQMGEAIGGYLVPGAGVAGNMAIGSLAETANQNGDFAENATKNAALNLGAQGALSGAAKLVGRGITALKGDIAPEAQKLINQASSADVPLMTSDVMKPTTKIGNQLQDYSEGVLAGTGPMRSAQQDARTRLINRFTETYGDFDPSVVVDSLKAGVAREKSVAQAKLKDIAGRMAGAKVDTAGTMRAIDWSVSELSKLKGVSDTQTISALKDYKQAILDTSGGDDAFELLDKLRTQFRVGVKGDRTIMPSQSQTMVDRVYNSFTNSLSKSIAKGLSPRDAAAWRAGKADYARMATDATQTRLKNVLNKGGLTPEAVNTIVHGQYGSDIARLYSKLDPKGKDMLRAAYISKIADKANSSPQKFMTEIDKLSKQANGDVFKVVFSGKHKKELDGLMQVLNATDRASKASVVTATGMTVSTPLRLFGNIATGGWMLAGEAGIGLLSRLYESPPTRNMLLRLANTKPGTPAYERALNQAAVAVRPIVVSQFTEN